MARHCACLNERLRRNQELVARDVCGHIPVAPWPLVVAVAKFR